MHWNNIRRLFCSLFLVTGGFLASAVAGADSDNAALTREAQARITPAAALKLLKQGNQRFPSDDTLGSLEFAARVAGSKMILVMGHNECATHHAEAA